MRPLNGRRSLTSVDEEVQFLILYCKFNGELWGAAEDQAPLSVHGVLSHRRGKTNPLRLQGSGEMAFKQKTRMLMREDTRVARLEELVHTQPFLLLI